MDTPQTMLRQALAFYGIQIQAEEGHFVAVEKDYRIEVEANGIYKLLWKGKVVAPFQDLDELCQFIQMS